MKDSNNSNQYPFLDMIERPAFFVEDGIITHANQSAKSLGLFPGLNPSDLIEMEQPEPEVPDDGSVWIQFKVNNYSCRASVQQWEQAYLYLLDTEDDDVSLKTLSLASVSMRNALSNLMVTTNSLAQDALALDEDLKTKVYETNKAIFQLLRIALNMSDAYFLANGTTPDKEPTEIGEFLAEIVEKAGALAEHQNFNLYLRPCPRVILTMDRQYMERAILNIISNAMRYTPEGGGVEIQVTETSHHCVIRFRDSGSGLSEEIRDNLYNQYRRAPAIESSDRGIGLGLHIARSIVADHGGALFIGPGPNGGTEAAISISKAKPKKPAVSSPFMYVDYAGEWDHTLIELARELDPAAFSYL